MGSMCRAPARSQDVPGPQQSLGPAAGGDFGSNADQAAQLDAASQEAVSLFLLDVRRAVDGYGAWRTGALVGTPQGERVPSAAPLDAATKRLWKLRDTDGRGLAMADPVARDALSAGVGGPPLSAEQLGWIEEWVGYRTVKTPQLVDLFCLTPPEIEHRLSLNVRWERGISGGVGVGPMGLAVCADALIAEIDTGACATLGWDLSALTIRYGNSTGIGWEADYLRSGPAVGASAGINAELLPILTGPTNHGREDLCGGVATPQPHHFVGPLGMTGMSAKMDAGWSAAAGGLSGQADRAETVDGKLTIRTAWGEIAFNTAGACGETKLGAGAEAGVTAIAPGYVGQAPGFDPAVTPAGPVAAGIDGATGEGRCLPPERPLEESLLSRVSFYFPRGSPDLYAHVDNAMVMGELAMALLNEADAHGAPTASRVVIAGHASPVWAKAADDAERVAANDALASARAKAAEDALVGLYNGMGGAWPKLSVDRDSAARDILDVSGAGSSEGEASTGDRCSDDGGFQRVDLWVYVMRPAADR